jgi:hypothetical protein
MAMDQDSFDRQVRVYVYEAIFKQGAIPSVAAIAAGLRSPLTEVVTALQRLAQSHVIVLQPDCEEISAHNFR